MRDGARDILAGILSFGAVSSTKDGEGSQSSRQASVHAVSDSNNSPLLCHAPDTRHPLSYQRDGSGSP